MEIERYRQPDYPIESLILRRWSPRAMSGEALTDAELGSLFEAARWAPSCFNEQPWRFLYAVRDSAHWPVFFELLVEGNRTWAAEAGALLVVLSKRSFTRNGKPNGSHSLDAGAAWQNLALQATGTGLVAHGMAGFDYARARRDLAVPEGYSVEMMIALGRPGDPASLPAGLREQENPSSRKPIEEFAFAGGFPAKL